MEVVATDSAVTVLLVAIGVTLMCTSLSQHRHYHCSPSTVTVGAVTLLSTPLLSQRCAPFRCYNAAHRCLTAVGFLLRNITLFYI